MTRLHLALVIAGLSALSFCAASFIHWNGYVLYYGDAEAHLNIARRIVDSSTPGWGQLGTVWLPLPHLLMAALVWRDSLWRTGLAGTITSGLCFVAAGSFLFAAIRRAFHRSTPAVVATCLFALNPNLLYLQSIPMTEAVFFASLTALLYFTVRFAQTPSSLAAAGGGIAALAGLLTRYEGWFLLPFVAVFLFRTKVSGAVIFCAIAGAGVVWWLAYNWWIFGNPLEFYNGAGSPQAIQAGRLYAGKGDWKLAWLYYQTACRLCIGAPLYWLSVLGLVPAVRRAAWPVLLLALPPIFYLWSIHSSGGTPIHVPELWPHSWYNTRYGLALLPLAAVSAGALASIAPRRLEIPVAAGVIAAAILPWLEHPRPDYWITWKESLMNSVARREWTRQAAEFLKPRLGPSDEVLTSFGDITAVFRTAGIPLRRTLTINNEPQWQVTILRPDLFLTQSWVVAIDGDEVQRAVRGRPNYQLLRRIEVKDAVPIEIHRRDDFPNLDENPLPESARRGK